MEIVQAGIADAPSVLAITRETIEAVYPHYYPQGAVAFFLAHHAQSAIEADIRQGIVYLCIDDGAPVGTVTIRGDEICRLFVLPAQQGRGFGRALLDYAEALVLRTYPAVTIDASLPGKAIYLKRGYTFVSYHTIETDGGDRLCYDVMQKQGGTDHGTSDQ